MRIAVVSSSPPPLLYSTSNVDVPLWPQSNHRFSFLPLGLSSFSISYMYCVREQTEPKFSPLLSLLIPWCDMTQEEESCCTSAGACSFLPSFLPSFLIFLLSEFFVSVCLSTMALRICDRHVSTTLGITASNKDSHSLAHCYCSYSPFFSCSHSITRLC